VPSCLVKVISPVLVTEASVKEEPPISVGSALRFPI
jgi:hypothetical protein